MFGHSPYNGNLYIAQRVQGVLIRTEFSESNGIHYMHPVHEVNEMRVPLLEYHGMDFSGPEC